ncbi:MAG: hypothetical protein E6G97_14830 [Alphaproteobacteria bacterium]|nr:MAG: hypothetical protein E6G97_14830 [Alphaproteobacteria bacterium]
MLPEPSPETWIRIRYEYEHTDKPIDDICFDNGVSPSTLRERMRRWRWTRRRQPISAEGPPPMPPRIEHAASLVPALAPIEPAAFSQAVAAPGDVAAEQPAPLIPVSEAAPPDPAVIVPQLLGAVARLLPAIEATVAKLAAGPMPPREMERAARALTSLTRTLRELTGLLRQYPPPEGDRGPDDPDEFFQGLLRKLEVFAAAEAAKDVPEGYAPDGA